MFKFLSSFYIVKKTFTFRIYSLQLKGGGNKEGNEGWECDEGWKGYLYEID